MGKTTALRSLITIGRRSSTTHFLRLHGIEPIAAAKKLARFARQVEREALSDRGVVVALDDIPAGDDATVDREVFSISRMVAAGATVAVSMLPEDELLAERLSGGIRLSSRELLVSEVLDLGPSDPLYEVLSLTGGIPSLVSALLRDNGALQGSRLVVSSTYYDALGHLIGSTLRAGLLDEEISLRLAMLLLGQGTFDDVASLTCANPAELALSLEKYAPLFGVSCHESIFRCYGIDTLDGLGACAPVLATKVMAWQPIFDSALNVLIERGEYGRAAIIARMTSSTEAIATVIDHAEDFVCAGELGLVRSVVGPAQAQMLVSPERAACVACTLSALGDKAARLPEDWGLQRGGGMPLKAEARAADILLTACRAALAGDNISVPSGGEGQLEGLAVHLQAIQLLRDGRPSAVQRIVGPYAFSSLEGTLAGALLRLDACIARTLLGDIQSDDEPCTEARDFLARNGFLALRDEDSFLLVLDALMRGSCDLPSIDALASAAERAGNELVRVAALVMGAAAEYVLGDYRGARLRSSVAAATAGRAGFTHLEAEVSILCRAAMGSDCSDEAPPDWEGACDTKELSTVAALVRASLEEEFSADVLRIRESLIFPSDEMWLLRVLISGSGDIPRRIRELIPHAWIAVLEPALAESPRSRSVQRLSRRDPVPRDSSVVHEVAAGARMRLCLLGGFSLYADGEPVPEWRIERRSAKAMLVFVALHPKLTAKRYEIIEQLWPDCDYKAGLDKIYQATSTLRREVGAVAPDLDLFLGGRGDKSVSLDSSLLECDFMEFAKAAREVLASEGDDERALEAVLRAEKIYAGDLFVPTRDVSGYVVARRLELRELYADAMVAGAEAALRLGRFRISARLADAATMADDLREDAAEVLIRALRASGRVFEAEQRYRRYAVRFVDRTHMPPPKRLRKAVDEGGHGEDGGSARRIGNSP
ncbi:BTAD domain-containing putative transcriptional regulator [Olsenella sp. Marseille-P4559]|uniref:AfsR/SARP family transcriptional regulator n=1 Tax=Olsenella sp. Marseille-P4559 TaxID=2364795 RepID=UPI0013EF3D75|nr:BTAD domain-containing putative transcriptional regulator [Olsenella sp. Marseille-P4559]